MNETGIPWSADPLTWDLMGLSIATGIESRSYCVTYRDIATYLSISKVRRENGVRYRLHDMGLIGGIFGTSEQAEVYVENHIRRWWEESFAEEAFSGESPATLPVRFTDKD